MKLTFLFFCAIIFFYGCKKKCDCYNIDNKTASNKSIIERPWQLTEIHTDSLSKLVYNNKYNGRFGLHLFRKDGTYFFAFLSKSGKLTQFDFDSNKVKKSIDVSNTLSVKDFYSALFINDTLYFINTSFIKGSENFYRKYILKDDGSVNLQDSLNISGELNCKNCDVYSKPLGQGMAYQYPYLILRYGNSKTKNFIDSKVFLKINLEQKSIQRIVDYPDCYRCSFIYDRDVSVIFNNNGLIISLFNQYDKLFLFEPGANKSKSFSFGHDCKLRTFDESKEMNLAYVRKYLENGERNITLLNISNKYYVALKRLAKNSLAEKSSYSLFVFDSSFKQVYSEVIQHPVFTPGIFNYKNGFLMFNDSLSKAYYYDFKK